MKELSLYIHIPFCKQKCFYCDFLSFNSDEKVINAYVDALCREILNYKDYKFKTIFIGGGTPTYLSLYGLNRLKETIKLLNFADDIEFTVEGNPGTFSEEKLKVLKEMGVNRISVGLQAWQNNLLKKIGRIHNIDEFKESYFAARKMGFENINVDLMFGLPDQTLDMWKETLKNIVELSPEHISCYSLIIEEETPFYDMFEKNNMNLPQEDVEREMYRYSKEYLKQCGYKQYEISNFAKENKECRHNLVYWNLDDYIGCGLGSHSYLNGYRISNIKNIHKYIENIDQQKSVVEEKNKNNIKDDMEEYMFLGLRKIEGIDKEDFKKKFEIEVEEVYKEVINKYKECGLLRENEGKIFLTPKGIELSNVVMSEFLLDE